MTAQPISGVNAPEILPITVFNVYLRFDQNVYKTTYVNQPKKPYVKASSVVKKRKIIPMIELIIPSHKTVRNEKLPVTVGLCCVRSILLSRSTSYQLFKISAPAMINVPPIAIYKNVSHTSVNGVFVK